LALLLLSFPRIVGVFSGGSSHSSNSGGVRLVLLGARAFAAHLLPSPPSSPLLPRLCFHLPGSGDKQRLSSTRRCRSFLECCSSPPPPPPLSALQVINPTSKHVFALIGVMEMLSAAMVSERMFSQMLFLICKRTRAIGYALMLICCRLSTFPTTENCCGTPCETSDCIARNRLYAHIKRVGKTKERGDHRGLLTPSTLPRNKERERIVYTSLKKDAGNNETKKDDKTQE
jgi:hypothetical protein